MVTSLAIRKVYDTVSCAIDFTGLNSLFTFVSIQILPSKLTPDHVVLPTGVMGAGPPFASMTAELNWVGTNSTSVPHLSLSVSVLSPISGYFHLSTARLPNSSCPTLSVVSR